MGMKGISKAHNGPFTKLLLFINEEKKQALSSMSFFIFRN